jgi:hypothetical protein
MKFSKIQLQIRNIPIVPALAVAIFGQTVTTNAQYANPPTWMPMTMLNVSFNTTNLTLAVVPESNYNSKWAPSAGPVLNVATNGTYDPSQPWSVLNGTAYSRRLGWNPASGFSLSLIQGIYGTNAGIWIESVSQSAGLNTYQAVGKYGVNSLGTTNTDGTPTIDPAANGYSGIFGTAGSSTKWNWDGKMDHNAYAVSLADISVTNQLFTATYKVYVGDISGNEILNPDNSSTSTTEVWTWQGPANLVAPSLLIQSKLAISWLGSSANYVVESAPTVDSTTWTAVTNTPVELDGKTVILVDPSGAQQYFRLQLAH